MSRAGSVVTLAPFVIVLALAIALALAGLLSAPRIASAPITSGAPTPAVVAAPSTAAPTTASRANDAAEMLRVHNELRVAVGATPVRGDERVSAAAQRHAEYLAGSGASGHDESAGAPGFTGASVADRLAAQGYPASTASEVATSFSTGTDGVRSLWVLPYHRLGLMHPHAVVAGWGHADVAGRSATVGVLVYDFASPSPDRVRSPAPGQRVPGSWSGEESPDVLPPGAARPVGYPVMVVFDNARPAELLSARVTDPGGGEVVTYVVPQLYERDYVAIVPGTALAPGARYHVRLELSVAGSALVDEWEFETER